MNIEELTSLGLSRNEANVYAALISFKHADANTIIHKTKFHKKIVYDNLERLIDKGLIIFIIKDGRKVFSISSPNMLSNYIEEQEKELEKKRVVANKLKKEIEREVNLSLEKQDASVYCGKQAVKSFYADTIKIGGDYYVIGAPKDSLDIMGELFWEVHHLKKKDNNQKSYLLLNNSLKQWGSNIKDKYTEIKYFENDVEPKTEIHIQSNFVAIIVWTHEPIIFKINSSVVVSSYKKYFEKLWKIAKR